MYCCCPIPSLHIIKNRTQAFSIMKVSAVFCGYAGWHAHWVHQGYKNIRICY